MSSITRVALAAAVVCFACTGAGDVPSDTALLQPDDSLFQAQAPDSFQVRFTTSEGEFTVGVQRDWAPLGADRFYNLVRAGYYDGNRFFRVVPGFMAQFGIHGDPAVNEAWADQRISDDPVTHGNDRGTIVFATAGPNTRTTQLFINFKDNPQLDAMGFAPFGRVVDGMNIVDRLYGEYGEGAPSGRGPDQRLIKAEGNEYLEQSFPELDYVQTAEIVQAP